MKRLGHVFDAVVEPENLRLAFLKVSRGCRASAAQRHYAAHLDDELATLREGLLSGCYPVGNYRRFTIHEPKERLICAAAFHERVLHHALMDVLEPHIEKWLVADTFACRKGLGQLRAVRRARHFAHRFRWFMKCDFRKYFDSIPHEGIAELVARKIKDPRLAAWLMKIVDTYETTPGRGLPIGNLTSQHLANLYLDRLDRFHTAAPGIGGYVRYMDDFVYWSGDKEALKAFRRTLAGFVEGQLGLTLKQTPFINDASRGMDFLGMRVYPWGIHANRASRRRFVQKIRAYDFALAQGTLDEAAYQQRVGALTAFLEQADTLSWRRNFFRKEEGRRRTGSGSKRVLRGGSWNNNARNCRSANRNRNSPDRHNSNNGFRVACSAAPQIAP